MDLLQVLYRMSAWSQLPQIELENKHITHLNTSARSPLSYPTIMNYWHPRVASQRSNLFGQIVRPAGEKLAGRLACHGTLYWGARLQAWVKPSALIARSETNDCHVSFWPGENGGLPDNAVWCHCGREECDNPTGLLASHQRVWLFGRIA